LPVGGNLDEPLLDFLRESLTRIGEEDEDLLDEIEQDDPPGVVQEDWKPEAVTWVITFETSWAVDDDLGVIRRHPDGPVKERPRGPESLESGEFPASIPSSSTFRAFDPVGWQFFDKGEFDEVVQGVLRRNRPRTGLRARGCYTKNTRRSGIMLSKPGATAITIPCCSGGLCSFGWGLQLRPYLTRDGCDFARPPLARTRGLRSR
jgi:hypothetical protein